MAETYVLKSVPTIKVTLELDKGTGLYRKTNVVEHGYTDRQDRWESTIDQSDYENLIYILKNNGWIKID